MSVPTQFIDALAFLMAFVRTRWGYRFPDRDRLERYQEKRLRVFLDKTSRNIPFYKNMKGQSLHAFPVLTKDALLRNFSSLNRSGITLEKAQDAGLSAERQRNFKATLPNQITVGLSSGTSGSRGVFLVSPRERNIWAGTIMARVLSVRAFRQLLNPFLPPLRVAFCLRSNSNLYTTTQGRRLHFHFGDLLQPLPQLIDWLNKLKPDLLIAPASVLRRFALAQIDGVLSIHPLQIISVAEVLEDDDRSCVYGAWRLGTEELYQCTEGFLGYTCSKGSLHLNEEFVHIEPEWIDAEKLRFIPLITDFTRSTQAFVRYRLDDVLQIDPLPCSCGRATRCLKRIEGRQDDVLWVPAQEGLRASDEPLRPIFPDVIRRAFMLAVGGVCDYRLMQDGMVWQVQFDASLQKHLAETSIRRELSAVLEAANCEAPEIRFAAWEPTLADQKRRRIHCIRKPRAGNSMT